MPGLQAAYASLVRRGALERDAAQERAVRRLCELEAALERERLAKKSSSLGWLFGRSQAAPSEIKGVYIHGEVGRGKTMLMDLFFASVNGPPKRRAHFHEFMLDVHERVHRHRQAFKRGEVGSEDPIVAVAAELAGEATLLCFDEFHVTDIADAMILGRLFTQLFSRGVVVVATSNVAPHDLYAGGLNRALFLPFIALLRAHMDVMRLDARTDFRLEKLSGRTVWHVPADAAADAALDAAFLSLTGGDPGAPQDLPLKGRTITVPRAANGVARFSFHDLCGLPRAAADFLRIAREYHTLVLAGVPVMDLPQRNEAKRFIILIDALYDYGVKLVASAAAPPDGIYTADHGGEAQEFKRTVSRLIEMGSAEYLARPHGLRDSAAGGATTGIVET